MPKRHLSDFFEATQEEITAIYSLLHKVKSIIDKEDNPQGYNVGINVGEHAGQTIMHLHVYLIPPYEGDIEKFMANYSNSNGVKACAVYSGDLGNNAMDRNSALKAINFRGFAQNI